MEKKNQNESPKIKRYYEPETSPLVPIYEWQEDEEGHHVRVETGKKNLDDEIQLYKDSCDIKVIIEKMMNGDVQTIRMLATPGLYGDANDYPQEVHPAAYAQGLHQLYENQPDAVKAKYPTYELFEKFFVGLTTEMVNQMFTPKVESEVSANGQ